MAATAAAAAAAVVTHYTGTGGLLAKITAGLERQGKSPDTAVASDLYAVDQFHIGGASFALRTMAHLAAKSARHFSMSEPATEVRLVPQPWSISIMLSAST